MAVIGHSWGVTTSLRWRVPFLRIRSSEIVAVIRIIQNAISVGFCNAVGCQAFVRRAVDPRVRAVVAVSRQSACCLTQPVLVASIADSSGEWHPRPVVPSGPEAIVPMRSSGALQAGHRLVLAEGVDHFSLRSFRDEPRPAAVGPLLLAWVNEQLDVSGALTFSGGGWGDEVVRLVDVSNSL